MLRSVKEHQLSAVVGRNCKRLRTDAKVTQDDLAKHARSVGLRWTASKVRDFEAGRNAPTFATVLAAAVALTHATGQDVSLADLVQDDGFVVLNSELKIRGPKLADVMGGQDWDLTVGDTGHKIDPGWIPAMLEQIAEDIEDGGRFPHLDDMPAGEIFGIRDRGGLDEERLAKRLGISTWTLAKASAELWRSTMSEERDRRVGAGANAQQRGHVTRAIERELKGLLHVND